ncbi:MAG: tetratricopeptide repeat protein [Planctomycetaceae bacterium]|nr:tetratricopeptide repeat protein [Planctomycetaceae bacterium]
MNEHLRRATFLMQQSRYELAESELRLALAEDSGNAIAHAFLAMCLSERDQHAAATDEAQQAILHSPDLAIGHYAMAWVMRERNRLTEARTAINEAIRIDPADVNSFAMLASIEAKANQWKSCRIAAERGLEIDPEDVDCTNLLAIAMTSMGDREQAGVTIREALQRDPDNTITHANEGWRLLGRHEPEKAMLHFQEALRLDASNEWARAGIVEAMKARHFIYRWMLSFFLWLNSFSPRVQILLVLGIMFGQGLLSRVLNTVPFLQPFAVLISLTYILFAWMTWTSSSLFNLVLMANRFGRLALTPKQRLEASLAGICVAVGPLSAMIIWFSNDLPQAAWLGMLAALLFPGMVIPVATAAKSKGMRQAVASAWCVGVLWFVLQANFSATRLTSQIISTVQGIRSLEESSTTETGQSTVLPVDDPEIQFIKDAASTEVSNYLSQLIAALRGIAYSTWLGLAITVIPERK